MANFIKTTLFRHKFEEFHFFTMFIVSFRLCELEILIIQGLNYYANIVFYAEKENKKRNTVRYLLLL